MVMITARKEAMASKARPGRLRIVAGNWRSRVLPIADVPGLRPTSERIRETLFNWIGPSVHGLNGLDLYAGTGALGFEALSRGAKEVDFVELSPKAVSALEGTVRKLHASGARIHKQDAESFIQSGAGPWDLIFLDPPFQDQTQEHLCRLIAEHGCLSDGGRVYVEQARDQEEIELPAGWEILRSKVAGNVRYSLLKA